MGRCASLRSLRTALTFVKSWITSAQSQRHHTLPRHAGHRFGKTVIRMRARAAKSSQIGTWPHNLHRISRWTSASTGECARQRNRYRCGSGFADRYPKVIFRTGVYPSGGNESSNWAQTGSTCEGRQRSQAQITCHTWPHAVEIPILLRSFQLTAGFEQCTAVLLLNSSSHTVAARRCIHHIEMSCQRSRSRYPATAPV